jgi:MFS transporter, DHA1 family, inner membrane transport protein
MPALSPKPRRGDVQTRRIVLLLSGGVVASAQIGKAIVAIPLIRADLGFGLDVAGLIVAVFATLGATLGVPAGVVVRRLGARRALVGGMSAIAVGNLIGATAQGEAVLLLARIVEGVGFFGVVLTIPSLLAIIVDDDRREFVMAMWSAYMPAGITLMLALGPAVDRIGWRGLWLSSACLASAYAALLAWSMRDLPAIASRNDQKNSIFSILRNPRCVVLALAFFAYSCQIFSLVFALPFLLTSTTGIDFGRAGLLSAGILAVSTLGHASSGFALRAGMPLWGNVAAAFLMFALSTFPIYQAGAPVPVAIGFAALALGVGGLAPGALYAAVPHVAPRTIDVPPAIGLLQQASNLGQFAGPCVLGWWAHTFGWGAAPGLIVPAALCGLLSALAIRGLIKPSRSTAPTCVRRSL